eukprot:7244325-Prymnesium_polylepis.1
MSTGGSAPGSFKNQHLLLEPPTDSRSGEEVLDPQRDVHAPHGGLDDHALAAALDSELERCAGYVAEATPADDVAAAERMSALLRRAAVPSFVLVDVTGRVPALLARSDFSLLRHAASCVVLAEAPHGAEAACETDAAFISYVDRDAPPATVCDAIWAAWSGTLPPLEPCSGGSEAGPNEEDRRCLVCTAAPSAAAPMRLCGACRAVCFCSARCQLAEMRNGSGLPHAAHCATFHTSRKHSEHRWRGAAFGWAAAEPSWLAACLERHTTSNDSLCARLERAGAHFAPFRRICGCIGGEAAPCRWGEVACTVQQLRSSFLDAPPPGGGGGSGDGGQAAPPAAARASSEPPSSWGEFY